MKYSLGLKRILQISSLGEFNLYKNSGQDALWLDRDESHKEQEMHTQSCYKSFQELISRQLTPLID